MIEKKRFIDPSQEKTSLGSWVDHFDPNIDNVGFWDEFHVAYVGTKTSPRTSSDRDMIIELPQDEETYLEMLNKETLNLGISIEFRFENMTNWDGTTLRVLVQRNV